MVRDIDRILAQAPRVPWNGVTFRVDLPIFEADNPVGSLISPGRWNLETFPVLYTSTAALVATWERIRHIRRESGEEMWSRLHVKISRIEVTTPMTLDLRSWRLLGIPKAIFTSDNYEDTQALAEAAYLSGFTGLLVPSATELGKEDGDYNVIIFYERTGNIVVSAGIILPEIAIREGNLVRVISSEVPSLPI